MENKFLSFSRVLVLAPHPDDAEYSVAGTVLKYPQTRFDILCLSRGGFCDITSGESRIQEVRNAWNQSNRTNYSLHFADVNNIREKSTEEWIKYIEETYLKRQKYDCILTPSDLDSHHEHILVSSFLTSLCRVTPYSAIQYKSPSTLDSWIPNIYISIDDQYLEKKRMLNEFTSQLTKPYFQDKVLDGFHTNFQCMKKGKGFVEPFKIISHYL